MSSSGLIVNPSRPESVGTSFDRRRAVPRGLLGMLGLIVAIETGVANDVLDFSDPTSLSWRLAAQAARDEAPGRSVLCMGDSLVKHAMIPKVIAARSGHDA